MRQGLWLPQGSIFMNHPLKPVEANFEKTQSSVPMRIDLSSEPSNLDRKALLSAEEHRDGDDQIQARDSLCIP